MPPGDPGQNRHKAKQRIKQVFEYLKALHDHRHPPIRQIKEQLWHLWLDDLPRYPSVEFPQRVAGQAQTPDAQQATEYSFLLRVRRPKRTHAPVPPAELDGWLQRGWDDPFKEVEVLESKNEVDQEGETITIRFADDPARPSALETWSQKRALWQEAEKPVRLAEGLFEKLYALHGRLQRESERVDLVIGDGILSWQQDEGNIYHPILLQRVQLVFDPQKPEFQIIDSDTGSEFYSGLFSTVAGVDPGVLRAQREEYEKGGHHPLDPECSAVLEGFVNRLAAHGANVGPQRPPNAAVHPTTGRGPVLFLRSRTKGFGTAIERVIENIDARDDFCEAFERIVGCWDQTGGVGSDPEPPRPNRDAPLDADSLYGKPANAEQLRIAHALDRYGSVLVQGPPGTGKSHTIANLIGHLLADGKSVLVTSHTTKALKVLRNHIVEDLRPLCVSVLDNDMDSRQQMEQSVQAISHRLSEWDPAELEREAERYAAERSIAIEQLKSYQLQLKNARSDEYREIAFGGVGIKPSEAARTVAAGIGKDDWIPSPIALGEPCPLSDREVAELYATNQTTRHEDDQYADRELPDPSKLLTPQQFANARSLLQQLGNVAQPDRTYWTNSRFTTTHITELEAIVPAMESLLAEFSGFDGWTLAAVDAGRQQIPGGGPWDHLLAKIEEGMACARGAQADLVAHAPAILDESSLAAQLVVATQIVEYLERGKRLSWTSLMTRSSWKQAIAKWQVKGGKPVSFEQVAAVHRLLALKHARVELRSEWDTLMASHGGPSSTELGETPERSAYQFAPRIRAAFEWWCRKWMPLEQRLQELGFDWTRFIGEQPPNLTPYGEMRRIVDACRVHLVPLLKGARDSLKVLATNSQFQNCMKGLQGFDRPEAIAMRTALEAKDSDAYHRAYDACIAARGRQSHALRRRELLAKLLRRNEDGVPIANGWAEAIRQRQGIHGRSTPPGGVSQAWVWRQLNDELDRRSRIDLEEIGQQVHSAKSRVEELTNNLIDRKAWASQLRRVRPSEQQALLGWLHTIQQIGQGFGQFVPLLRREAQERLKECRSAVPVWIMPLARLVESFDFSKPAFDVAIIDEASQCDVMALLVLMLARKVIVVGDDKQVTPSAVGQNLAIVHNLIQLHLQDIPNHVLYDGRMSIYKLASQAFPATICLTEHFRCVPDIIEFSNHLCYDGRIKPLREQSSSPLQPSVVAFRVKDGERVGNTNPIEAETIASLVVAAAKHPAYAKQTFGVITLLGENQALKIDTLLRSHLATDEYDRRRIVCGNSSQFQGDERHVMFLSMVDSSGEGPLSMNQGIAAQQRYNVAASRALNQMWVVYSLNHDIDLKPGDLRRRLIEHALDPGAITRDLQVIATHAESPFEQQVGERLILQGYRIRPQWPVGRYRIDIVVEGERGRVAVECDGERYHTSQNLEADMDRQAILERLGWRFIRIRGSDFFRNPAESMEKVFSRLSELGVSPRATDLQAESNQGPQKSVVDEVIRHAAELRAQWRSGTSPASAPEEDEQDEEAEPSGDDPAEDAMEIDLGQPLSNAGIRLGDVTESLDASGESTAFVASNTVPTQQLTLELPPDGIEDIVETGGPDPGSQTPELIEQRVTPLTLEEQILQFVMERGGLRGREIAEALGKDRSLVNSILHGRLSPPLVQDDEYRWHYRGADGKTD